MPFRLGRRMLKQRREKLGASRVSQRGLQPGSPGRRSRVAAAGDRSRNARCAGILCGWLSDTTSELRVTGSLQRIDEDLLTAELVQQVTVREISGVTIPFWLAAFYSQEQEIVQEIPAVHAPSASKYQ